MMFEPEQCSQAIHTPFADLFGKQSARLDRRGAARLVSIAVLFLTVSGCGLLTPPRASAPAEAPPLVDAAMAEPSVSSVWTARAEVPLFDGVAGTYSLQRVFTRLDVVAEDSLGLRLRCTVCLDPVEGYAAPDDLVTDFYVLPPEIAAWADLADFALAIRSAAGRHDIDALRRVMDPDFSFSFLGIQTPETAVAAWGAEQFATLDRVADLLDQGLSTGDERLWTAPPAFSEEHGYQGLRLGFRRGVDGRWEWLFLIRGLVDR